MRHYGALRLFRSLIITGVIVGLAAGGHLIGGGNLPAPMITAALAALLLLPVTRLAGRQLSFSTLLGLLGTGQLILHEVFITLSASVQCQTLMASRASHHHEGTSRLHCLPPSPAALDTHVGLGIDTLAMLAGHTLAVFAAAWLLRQGETALWQLLAWLRPLVVLLRPVATPAVGPRTFAHDPALIPAPWRNLRLNSLRGPPAAAFPRATAC